MAGFEVEQLSWRYGDAPALDQVSFSVAPGRFCALLGPNGAGKTTLFALATRLFRSRVGRVRIDGVDLDQAPGAALARLGVVFQQPTLDLDLSVAQNLRYFGALHGLGGADLEHRAKSALALLDLADRWRDRVGTLNGGHRRRLEIARALLHQPRVLLLDEPTVGLDVAARREITRHVHEICERFGVAALWATHLVDEVSDDDDLVVLHRGRIRAQGRAAEVVRQTGAVDLPSAFLSLTAVERAVA